jgi:sec-independent protein translocase protein TatB
VFDIGFSEIIVCAVVALVVIGPERMPEAVRTVGLWIGRLKRSLRETRSEIERQIGVDDIRRQLHNEEIMQSLEDARRNMDNVISETQKAIDSTAEVVTREYKSEPDLPYHSHTEEQTAEALAELPKPDIAQENIIIPEDTSTVPHTSIDKKASL